MFSGRYAVITVDNVFSKGKFEQTLDLVRLHNQEEYDNLTGTAYPLGGTQWFRTPDFNTAQFPTLQGFGGGSIGGLLNSVVNSGTGAISGITNSLIKGSTNTLISTSKELIGDGMTAVNEWWNKPEISWENLGTGGFENAAGGATSSGLVSDEVSSIPGLSTFPSEGSPSSGTLVSAEAASIGAGTGAIDQGTQSNGLTAAPPGVNLGGLF